MFYETKSVRNMIRKRIIIMDSSIIEQEKNKRSKEMDNEIKDLPLCS